MRKFVLGLLMLLAFVGPSFADSQGSATGGTIGTQSTLAGCQYQTSPSTLSGNQQTGLRCDSAGNLLTAPGAPGTDQDVNLVGINGAAPVTGSGTATGALRIELPTNGTGTIATITNPVGIKGADGSTITSITNGFPTIGVYKNVSVIPTVQNASYTAGQSLGGLQTLTVLPNGLVQQVQLASKGGSVIGTWVYIWNKSPANSTCTDKTNFVVSQADNQNLVVQPFLLTPALGVSSNDASTYASQTNIAAPFVNNDTSPGSSIYVCLLAAATVTPATTSDLRLNLQAAQ